MTQVVQKNFSAAMFPPGGGGGFGAGVQRWAGLVLQVLAMFGQPASLLSTVLRRMNQESGGNPFAINLWDTNAQRGDPSRGLMQTIMGTFLRFAGPFRGRGIYDPFANVYASFAYAISQYGSLASAFNRAGGYAKGTKSARRGWAWVGENGRELVNFGGGESIEPGGRGGTTIVWTGDIVIRGHALATKQEIGALVSDALTEFERKGGRTR
jgi:SLT domain-containing protein